MSAAVSRGWPAPAKLNLFLHVTGRRADGYHLLQTLFQFLDHGDTLDFELRADGRITRPTGPGEIAEAEDLVVRAAQLLRESSGVRHGVDIHLHKRLPHQAGLGGGSSDAATTLVALNRLWAAGLDTEALAALALELGADVPVFVRGRAAWAEGVGEILTPVDLPEPWYLVLQPGCSVATREVFQAPDLTRNSAAITIARFYAGEGQNDFEPVVRKRYPPVAQALDWLGQRAPARLTGSGACVFAAFESENAARLVLSALPQAWQGFVARGRNRSPLLDRLAQSATE
ncbi:MAG: 4-(cytidine 5'-diphospho)-2-C-methyl-D-erythritol kinase [Gammaproteobacteria bacterium]|nr:4-(cytidine 5'-diphospho)-2-C-methyl-D-erythritol kinase [Gammaproteobacteria bacterium]MBU6509271.1 4-(cytidine 5'-diphospho)-2-C-methyl-D-erythritol kinase [Gammaproteobacteria bacterium]MDE1983212.1 4-(cytidine 5'-diphospho)-2-C-methyl-D-erythritol kinase [Gammaproteobacteria bacterium]MDE2107725.1 4-(cytidine 5'-diphospho)-2-C-methyl-D-erythritol kinase [Gammaproteobacteria bacterium]MDE2461347.1 4-(cytidine 5'-diphospho)-2-C-methyl-D-erythritol kinase [Gammaproteobacteria bacterium]